MPAIVFLTQAAADAYAAAVASRFGYPRPGVDIGPGAHVPPAQSQTAAYGAVLKHPTLALWAFPDDPVVKAQRAALPLPGGAVSQALDATWDPVIP